MRDIASGDDAEVAATVAVIAAVGADILLLLDVDHDAGQAALDALAGALAARDAPYPHRLSLRPNTGRPTGVDLDGDGRSWRARDAHGYGLFSGDGGMALLSRHPLGAVRDFSALPWVALPGSAAADVTPEAALPDLSLHSVAAWDVEVLTPGGPLHILASHASPPVFDGPEDRNGLRNADELRFWALYLDGWTPEGAPFAGQDFVLMGTFNVDPDRGEGRRAALATLLSHPRVQDPAPTGAAGTATADWPVPGPGPLRVDYVLPSTGLRVADAGVLWPAEGDEMHGIDAATAAVASDHRLVWVDLGPLGSGP